MSYTKLDCRCGAEYKLSSFIGGKEIQSLIEDRSKLLEACKRLLHFNEELCRDVNVSIHYPSADFARKAIQQAKGDKPTERGE